MQFHNILFKSQKHYTGNPYELTCRLQNLFFDIVFLNTNLPQTCLVEQRMLFVEAKFCMVGTIFLDLDHSEYAFSRPEFETLFPCFIYISIR
jgi:hypothetical protein